MFTFDSNELETTAFLLRIRMRSAIEQDVDHQLEGLGVHLERLTQFSEKHEQQKSQTPTMPTLRADTVQDSLLSEPIIEASEGEEDGYIVIPSVL